MAKQIVQSAPPPRIRIMAQLVNLACRMIGAQRQRDNMFQTELRRALDDARTRANAIHDRLQVEGIVGTEQGDELKARLEVLENAIDEMAVQAAAS